MFEKLFHRKKIKELNTAIRLLQEEVKEKTLSTNVNHGKYLEVSMRYEDLKEEFGALRSYQREVKHEREVLEYKLDDALNEIHDQENHSRELESTMNDLTEGLVKAQAVIEYLQEENSSLEERLTESFLEVMELSQELSECQLEEAQ